MFRWKNDCDFTLSVDDEQLNTPLSSDCGQRCSAQKHACNYFSHDGTQCYFMFSFEWAEPKEKKGWTCGFIPRKIWKKSKQNKEILRMSDCIYPSNSSYDGQPASAHQLRVRSYKKKKKWSAKYFENRKIVQFLPDRMSQ